MKLATASDDGLSLANYCLLTVGGMHLGAALVLNESDLPWTRKFEDESNDVALEMPLLESFKT